MKPITNVIGFDDAPFARASAEPVRIVGTICSRTRLDGIVSGFVARNGDDATARMVQLVQSSQFEGHIRAVLLKGIAVAGFNVVDIHELSERLAVPVLVVMRRQPDYPAIRAALEAIGNEVQAKWQCIQRAGEPQCQGNLWVQFAGMELERVTPLLGATTLHGTIPEALRLAHLIAGGITTGKSRGRA